MNRRTKCCLALLTTTALATAGVFHGGALAQQEPQRPGETPDTPDRPAAKQKDEMMCPMMAGLREIKLFAESPAVLQARGEELELTAEQKMRLEQIERTARERARRVLTAEQRKQIEDAPEGPLSMMELSRASMKRMDRQHHGMVPDVHADDAEEKGRG